MLPVMVLIYYTRNIFSDAKTKFSFVIANLDIFEFFASQYLRTHCAIVPKFHPKGYKKYVR